MMRCSKTDLPANQCAHCTGASLPVGHDWTTSNPVPLPPAVPYQPDTSPRISTGPRPGILSELENVYHRLFENLPTESRGRSNDNAAGYAAYTDPRRAPVRVEVLDLIAQIEDELPEYARLICGALGVIRCLAFPHDSANGNGEADPRVEVALDTLGHHWHDFTEAMPEYGAAVADRLGRMIAVGRRQLGQTSAPVPLAQPCPECGMPTVFRIETERGAVAVCGNPADRDDWGRKRQWTEIEWEDAHPRRSVVHP